MSLIIELRHFFCRVSRHFSNIYCMPGLPQVAARVPETKQTTPFVMGLQAFLIDGPLLQEITQVSDPKGCAGMSVGTRRPVVFPPASEGQAAPILGGESRVRKRQTSELEQNRQTGSRAFSPDSAGISPFFLPAPRGFLFTSLTAALTKSSKGRQGSKRERGFERDL